MVVLPPGTQLQLMYLHERLKILKVGHFIEIGPGNGDITHALLSLGWTGCVYDFEPTTCEHMTRRFSNEILEGRLKVFKEDFLSSLNYANFDLIISCMVIEHLDDRQQQVFMEKSLAALRPGGIMLGFVPASPSHWDIEDEIAGHYRRYTRSSLGTLLSASGWMLRHVAGLTYPLSNWLLPLSNFLVYRQEKNKLSLSQIQKTKQSGQREVKYKTTFPRVLGFFLNPYVLAPFHYLQKCFSNSENALVLYFEAEPEKFPRLSVKKPIQ